MKIFPATYNPEDHFDYFVPSTMAGVTKMLAYANKSAAGVPAFSKGL